MTDDQKDQHLPLPNDQNRFTYSFMCELFYKQVWAMAELMNDVPKKVETYKFCDFILFFMKKRLHEEYPQLKDDNN